jgi:hypothetical protein
LAEAKHDHFVPVRPRPGMRGQWAVLTQSPLRAVLGPKCMPIVLARSMTRLGMAYGLRSLSIVARPTPPTRPLYFTPGMTARVTLTLNLSVARRVLNVA